MRPDLVIFDCDGVLIDSEGLACAIDADELSALGYAITLEEVVRRFAGVSAPAMRAAIENDWGRKLPAEFEARVKARVEAAYRAELAPIAGMASLVRSISMPICVASGSPPQKLQLGLELTGMLPSFAPHVFSATMVARGKPAPDLFLFAAERMGVAPAACLVVEDSIAGVQAGVAAGMTVIGFTAGSHCACGHSERLLEEGAREVARDALMLGDILKRFNAVGEVNSRRGHALATARK